jgi:LysR family transcriptional regulator, regulator for bpeEF and oprC
MTIDRLRATEVFIRVAELSSFTEAADALNMPKPSVSVLVRDLETHLGVKLFQRTTRRVSLTADGTAYLERARQLLHDFAELETQVRGDVVAPRGRLRVDVPAAMGRHLLMPALPDFLARYPEITLEVGSTDRPVDLIREGIDCVVRGGNLFDESLAGRKLGVIEVLTLASPDYLKLHGVPRTLTDLDGHHFVNFFSAKTGKIFPFEFFPKSARMTQDAESNQAVQANQAAQTIQTAQAMKQEISRPHRVAANDADSYIAAGVAGMGLIQSPANSAVREHLEAGRLVQVLEKFSAGELPIYVLYPRNRHLSARIRAFVDWIAVVFAKEYPEPSMALIKKSRRVPKR